MISRGKKRRCLDSNPFTELCAFPDILLHGAIAFINVVEIQGDVGRRAVSIFGGRLVPDNLRVRVRIRIRFG